MSSQLDHATYASEIPDYVMFMSHDDITEEIISIAYRSGKLCEEHFIQCMDDLQRVDDDKWTDEVCVRLATELVTGETSEQKTVRLAGEADTISLIPKISEYAVTIPDFLLMIPREHITLDLLIQAYRAGMLDNTLPDAIEQWQENTFDRADAGTPLDGDSTTLEEVQALC